MTLYLWDASDYDWPRGPMDLAAAKADGIVGFSFKATEATWIRHVHTGEALARARDAGLEFIGAYHVVRSTDPHEQVDYFLAYLDEVAAWWRAFPGFFLQVDLEVWDYDRVTADTGKRFAAALVEAQPKKVITYASRGQYGDQLSGIVTPLWNANYATNPAAHYPDAYPGDGSARWIPYSGQKPVFLQYGSQLRIGTQPGCDCSAFRGSLDDLRALIGAPAPQEDDMIAHLWKDPTGQQWYVTGPLQVKRAVSQTEADSIRYYAKGQPGIPGFTLVEPGTADPAVIPGVDITHLGTGGGGSGLTPEQLAEVSGAAHNGAASAIDGAIISSATISTAP